MKGDCCERVWLLLREGGVVAHVVGVLLLLPWLHMWWGCCCRHEGGLLRGGIVDIVRVWGVRGGAVGCGGVVARGGRGCTCCGGGVVVMKGDCCEGWVVLLPWLHMLRGALLLLREGGVGCARGCRGVWVLGGGGGSVVVMKGDYCEGWVVLLPWLHMLRGWCCRHEGGLLRGGGGGGIVVVVVGVWGVRGGAGVAAVVAHVVRVVLLL